jgi:hypothetical protein
MFKVCYASGALHAFMVARSRGGATEEQLTELKARAAAESAQYQSRARPSSYGGNVVDRERLDRARRERAQARRAFAPLFGGPAA